MGRRPGYAEADCRKCGGPNEIQGLCISCDRARHREKGRARRVQTLEATRRYRAKTKVADDPVKKAARAAVYYALKVGKLVKPASCPKCGQWTSKFRMHAHHHDYGKQLDVEWVCSRCHGSAHRI